MKALVFKEFGTAEKLKIIDMPIPEPGNNEILVKVEATTIDNVDIIIRRGLYKTQLLCPAITGRDLVGSVAKIGKNVKHFSIGEKVWTNSAGFDGRMGATAEYTLVEEERLYHAPESVDPIRLVASVHSSSTAQIVSSEVMKLNTNTCILIEGAAGNVGRKFVQCAHALGAKIITTSSEKDFNMLKKLGACESFSYDTEGMKKLATQSSTLSIDHIVDTSGKVSISQNLSLLNIGGQLTIITPPPKDTAFNAQQFYTRAMRIEGFVLSRATARQLAENAKILNRYFKEGLLLEDNIELHSFADAPTLNARMEANGAHGIKYVLKPL
ncbi:MAG: quinone oxidoreductase family protein [Fermentimonas sp.]|jgi:NADPH:quinone reductase-like Zn-dependent oxidoreductase